MTSENRGTQIKVGIFLLIGLLTIGLMVVYFGRLGEGVASYYNIRVEFSNASGLRRGSEVLLAGARIGRVLNEPQIMPEMNGVFVELRINDAVKIPSASDISIGSTGLLGDKYVQVVLKKNGRESTPIAPGSTIQGGMEGGGIGGMAESAGDLVAELRATVANVNSVVTKLDTGILNEDGIKSLRETLQNLQKTSATLATASAKVDGVVTKAEATIESGKGTMDSAKKAADELQRALADVRAMLRDIKNGQGALGALVSNRETAENLRSLVANLRRYGILWYRDGEKGSNPAPSR